MVVVAFLFVDVPGELAAWEQFAACEPQLAPELGVVLAVGLPDADGPVVGGREQVVPRHPNRAETLDLKVQLDAYNYGTGACFP